MRKQLSQLFTFGLFAFSLLFASTTIQAQNRPYRVSDRNVQYLLNRIETRTDLFKRSLDPALDNSRINNTNQEDNVLEYVKEFENSTDALKQKFSDKQSVSADVEDVLTRAAYINQFMTRNRLNAAAQRNWTNVRTDLNTLANYYSVSWNWTNPVTPINTATTGGPYRVNDTTVSTLLSRIETGTDNYKRALNNALDRSRLNNTNREDNVLDYVTAFENATDALKRNFNDRRSTTADVNEVLNRASYIDTFMRTNNLANNAERQWSYLATNLETLAKYYNVSWNKTVSPNNNNSNVGGVPFNVSEANVRTLITRIEQKTDTYKRNINNAVGQSAINNTRSERDLNGYVADFEKATNALKSNFDARRSTTTDVEEVLNRAYFIDGFMRDYRFTASSENDWRLLRTDLNTLSNYYNVNFDFNNRQYTPASKFDTMLTGTYRLNTAQSDNVNDVVNRATTIYPAAQRDRIQRNLERRLNSPAMLAIEKRDKEVTVASSTAPQVIFTADNTARTETTSNGRTIKVTANTYYDGVALTYEGDRINDFYVNFVPMSNGQLKVVRRVYLENKNDTVTVASIYDKTNDTAQFYNLNDNNNNNNNTGGLSNDFIVPNNTQIIAVLNSAVSTKASQNGDRFAMQVSSPSQYNGATLEGRVTKAERSGQVSGRANVSLEFDTIRLRNGQSYKFAGIIDNVKLASGEKVTVNNEGSVRDNNQTTKTVQRAGIGAALGALIGAVAGGGQGAAIGAAVGAGAGAGTVILQGRDDVELDQGSEFTITATAPSNINR